MGPSLSFKEGAKYEIIKRNDVMAILKLINSHNRQEE